MERYRCCRSAGRGWTCGTRALVRATLQMARRREREGAWLPWLCRQHLYSSRRRARYAELPGTSTPSSPTTHTLASTPLAGRQALLEARVHELETELASIALPPRRTSMLTRHGLGSPRAPGGGGGGGGRGAPDASVKSYFQPRELPPDEVGAQRLLRALALAERRVQATQATLRWGFLVRQRLAWAALEELKECLADENVPRELVRGRCPGRDPPPAPTALTPIPFPPPSRHTPLPTPSPPPRVTSHPRAGSRAGSWFGSGPAAWRRTRCAPRCWRRSDSGCGGGQ